MNKVNDDAFMNVLEITTQTHNLIGPQKAPREGLKRTFMSMVLLLNKIIYK